MSTFLIPNRMLPQMVSRSRPCYEEDLPFRRYNARNHGYSLDRDLSLGSNHNFYSRSQYVGIQDSRDDNNSPDQDETPQTRRRIPVACGRCRKRKIRCSGDNGGPCTNCKTAGHEECLFLRVSSTETTMIKNANSGPDFDFGVGSSRTNCNLVSCYHAAQSAPLPTTTAYPTYRNNSLSSYQTPIKTFYPTSNYSEFGDDNVDYGLHLSLHTLPGDQLGMGTGYAPTTLRNWASTPQLKNLPFLDQQTPVYSHGQSSYNTTSYDTRPHITPESKLPHLTTVQQTLPYQQLPAPVNLVMDRQLPHPAPMPLSRPAQMNQLSSSADGMLQGTNSRISYMDYGSSQTVKVDNSNGSGNYNSSGNVSGNGNVNYNGTGNSSGNINGNSNHSTPESSVSTATMYDNGNSNHTTPESNGISTATYTPLTTQSPESLNSAQSAYSTASFSLPASQQPQQVYTPSHNGLVPATEPSGSYSNVRKGSVGNNGNENTSYQRLRLPDSGSYTPNSNSEGSNSDYNTANSSSERYRLPESTSYEPSGSGNANTTNPSYNGDRYRLPESDTYVHSSSNYGPSYNPSDRRGSQFSQGSYKQPSMSSQGGYPPHDGLPSALTGTLVNGHQYYPASSSSNQYPAPSIDIQPQPRRPSGVLA